MKTKVGSDPETTLWASSEPESLVASPAVRLAAMAAVTVAESSLGIECMGGEVITRVKAHRANHTVMTVLAKGFAMAPSTKLRIALGDARVIFDKGQVVLCPVTAASARHQRGREVVSDVSGHEFSLPVTQMTGLTAIAGGLAVMAIETDRFSRKLLVGGQPHIFHVAMALLTGNSARTMKLVIEQQSRSGRSETRRNFGPINDVGMAGCAARGRIGRLRSSGLNHMRVS